MKGKYIFHTSIIHERGLLASVTWVAIFSCPIWEEESDTCRLCHCNRLPNTAYLNIECPVWVLRSIINLQIICAVPFTGNCILRVWHHGSALLPCKCPICRRVITLLIPCEASIQHHHDPEVGEILENVQRYNRLFGGGSHGLIQVLLIFKNYFLSV